MKFEKVRSYKCIEVKYTDKFDSEGIPDTGYCYHENKLRYFRLSHYDVKEVNVIYRLFTLNLWKKLIYGIKTLHIWPFC